MPDIRTLLDREVPGARACDPLLDRETPGACACDEFPMPDTTRHLLPGAARPAPLV